MVSDLNFVFYELPKLLDFKNVLLSFLIMDVFNKAITQKKAMKTNHDFFRITLI